MKQKKNIERKAIAGFAEAHGSAIRRLPASIQKIFGGEITSSTVAEYHRLWAAWHRNIIRLNKVYNCQEDDEIHQAESLLHDAMADAVSPNDQAQRPRTKGARTATEA